MNDTSGGGNPSPQPINISGVFPHLAVKAEHKPARTETGIGALMPWADRLWFVTYVAHRKGTGAGTGLFTVDNGLTLTKRPESRVGTYANRLIHHETSQLIIGPHIIEADGRVRTFESLVDTRLTATLRHLTDPANKVYFQGMEGEFIEADVRTLETKRLFDLTTELGAEKTPPHFKDAFSDHGRVVVANNSYYPADFSRGESDGRLAEWDGKGAWKVIARTQFNTVTGRASGNLGRAIYAVGQDRASALLYVFLPETGWKLYRLPKGTHTQDHAWTTEWPRIREVESERWLMNASGLFYELPAMTYGNAVRGLRPICTHLRIIGDFCAWNGLLVMAGDQTTPINDSNPFVGQPQANLWLGKTDDLWQWGRPQGWGGPWWETPVLADHPSDPYLMTGFEHKCLHIRHESKEAGRFSVEVDFQGTGAAWCRYAELRTESGYVWHTFPPGFSAHWVRLVPHQTSTAVTAQFFYT